ncbi:MAG: hypothetical protein MJ241_01105 [Bacilli bacterium]|nr:hypothetical protein [Bacilli bacterium]
MDFKLFMKKYSSFIAVPLIAVTALAIGGGVFLNDYNAYKAYEKQYDENAAEIKGSYAALPEEVIIDNDYVTYNGNNDTVQSSKSAYKNSVILNARDAVVAPLNESKAATYEYLDDTNMGEAISGLNRAGGAISFTVNTEKHGMSDIEISMMTNWMDDKGVYYSLPNITDFIKIQINKLNVQTKDLELSNDREGFTSVILKNTNLVTGSNTLTITTSEYNSFGNKNTYLYVMPDVKNVTFLCETAIAKPSLN